MTLANIYKDCGPPQSISLIWLFHYMLRIGLGDEATYMCSNTLLHAFYQLTNGRLTSFYSATIFFFCFFFVHTAGAIAAAGAHFGPGTGPILLDNVECTGSEQRLTACPNQRFGQHNCLHSEDASVICQRKQAMWMTIKRHHIPLLGWAIKFHYMSTISVRKSHTSRYKTRNSSGVLGEIFASGRNSSNW